MAALTERDREVVGICLRAAASDRIFDHDVEYPTIFGLLPEEVAIVAAAWPEPPQRDGLRRGLDADHVQRLAVSNALANLLGYPHGYHSAFERFVGVAEGEVRAVSDRWRLATGAAPSDRDDDERTDEREV
ncbi:MAG TPA: hypothetical protein VF230_09110 [Acidimicrobiales bacterium]